MATMGLNELKPGMRLAQDLRDPVGRLLVGKGAELTAQHLKILKTWGIEEAQIEQAVSLDEKTAPEELYQITNDILDRAARVIRLRFSRTNLDQEVVSHLFHICTVRKAQMIARRAKDAAFSSDDVLADASSAPTGNVQCVAAEFSPAPRLEARDLLQRAITLPSTPATFVQINEAVSNPRSTSAQLVSIISMDPGLCATLLRIVNSAFYGFSFHVDTVSRAIAIIGTSALSSIALASSVITMFKNISTELLNMRSFWMHSIACGTIARIIASYTRTNVPERFFVAGLLHDIGRLALLIYMPDKMKYALVEARQKRAALDGLEVELLGVSHTELGGELAKKWRLPPALERAIRFHHSCDQAGASNESAIVHVADIIATALEIGGSGQHFVPSLVEDAWKAIGLPVHILDNVVKQADRQVSAAVQLLLQPS